MLETWRTIAAGTIYEANETDRQLIVGFLWGERQSGAWRLDSEIELVFGKQRSQFSCVRGEEEVCGGRKGEGETRKEKVESPNLSWSFK